MKIPYWDAQITLYKKAIAADGRVSWNRSVHNDCFWQRKNMRDRVNGAEFKTINVVCRIPVPYPDVRIGDIIVYGIVTDEIDEYVAGSRSTDLLEKYAGSCMLVSDVHHNIRKMLGLDHLYAGG